MTATIKLRKIGNSLGLILPREVADQLHVSEGDTHHVVTDAGGAPLTPFDPNFDAAMGDFDKTRRRYRNALRAVIAIQGELITDHGALTGPPRMGDVEAAPPASDATARACRVTAVTAAPRSRRGPPVDRRCIQGPTSSAAWRRAQKKRGGQKAASEVRAAPGPGALNLRWPAGIPAEARGEP